jgi:hypothetical protein
VSLFSQRRYTRAPGAPSFHDALVDPNLFGATFNDPSFAAWHLLAKAIEGDSLDTAERAVFEELTNRSRPPTSPPDEIWIVKGRRSGGSLFASAFAVYTGAFGSFGARLAPGEVATIMLLAADRRQARVLMHYCAGFIDQSPLLTSLVVNRTAESLTLSTRVTIEIHTSSFRSVRGYAIALAICDEIAFWESDDQSANPATEVLAAVRPALASLGGRLVCLSSPYARKGPFWETFTRKFGASDPRGLVIKGTTQQFNPTIDPTVISRALEDDEASARAEWLAEFRKDVESFVSREAVDACVVRGRRELASVPNVNYVGFVDPSGGSADSMTLAIAHTDNGRGILDTVVEVRPPFSPQQVVATFAAVLKTYRVTKVSGDRYGGEWPREQFRQHGIAYQVAEQDRSGLYLTLLPALNSGRVELLDHTRLLQQLLNLERRVGPTGKDRIDHGGWHSHDDVVNSVAGALVLAIGGAAMGRIEPWVMEQNLAAPSVLAATEGRFFGSGSGVSSLANDAFGSHDFGTLARDTFGRD